MSELLAQRFIEPMTECPPSRGRRVGRCRRWFPSLLPALVALSLHLVAAGPARAQVAAVPAPAWATTAVREPLALGPGNALYVADWWRFAVRTGSSVAFDGTGAIDSAWPAVDSSVQAIAPDGAGGWFLAGAFTKVGGQRRDGLAHITAGGTLDPVWAPMAAGGPVHALAVVGDIVYAGGDIASINGQRRSRLAALDRVSGRPLPWSPRVDSDVFTLAANDGVLYAGGWFDRVDGMPRKGLAAFDAASGALSAWNPGLAGSRLNIGDGAVETIAVSGTTLYVAGDFTAAAGHARAGLAAFELTTGALTAWAPQLDAAGSVTAFAATGETVYVGGSFDQIGGARRSNLAALDGRTGEPLPGWRADVGGYVDYYAVNALTVAGDRLYLGGTFYAIAGQPRANLAAVSAATGAPLAWDPRPDDTVSSIGAAGEHLVAGGSFLGIGSEARSGLAAVDLTTAAPLPLTTSYRPGEYSELSTLAVQGHTVFAAERCAGRGCAGSRQLGRVDLRTGRVRRWPSLTASSGEYYALAAYGRRLYVGGYFRTIGGRRRSSLAAIDTRTGRVLRWRLDTNWAVVDLAIDGHTLYVIGSFTRAGGQRRPGAAAVDLRSGRLTSWRPRRTGISSVDALAVTAGRVYLAGEIGRGGLGRQFVAAVDRADGRVERWNRRVNRWGVSTLAVIDDTVYAGGSFTSISGVRRQHVAALDTRTLRPTPWNPGANADVQELRATPAGLLVHGEFDELGGAQNRGLGVFPLLGSGDAQHQPPSDGDERRAPGGVIGDALRSARSFAAPSPAVAEKRGAGLAHLGADGLPRPPVDQVR